MPSVRRDNHNAEKEEAMKVEVLYFAGCPNHPPALARVRHILREEAVSAELVEVEVRDAAMAREVSFLGSPTVRIDGRDVERSARTSQAFGFGCRSYVADEVRTGLPPVEWIRDAVQEAKGKVAL